MMKRFTTLFRRSPGGIFASASLSGHLLRGVIATVLLTWALDHQSQAVLSFLAAIGALVALRGCPVCWSIGLVETMLQRGKTSSPRE